MKNKIKFVLIISSLLFLFGCSDTLNLSEGYGFVTLKINGISAGRTILPNFPPDFATTEFEAFTLIFESPGKDSVIEEWTKADMDDSQPIRLEAGIWSFRLEAYMDTEREELGATGLRNNIVVADNTNVAVEIVLSLIIGSGTGFFNWNINMEDIDTIKFASMMITPLNTETGTPEKTYYFVYEDSGTATETTEPDNTENPLELNVGYYIVKFNLSDGNREFFREEYLHIYKERISIFEWDVDKRYFVFDFVVSNGNDQGQGSLRYAIAKAEGANNIIYIDDNVSEIQLESRLVIEKSLIIKGSGVTITRRHSWTTVSPNTQLLLINGNVDVEISGINFSGGRANNSGAIRIEGDANLTLESCIFSGNTAILGNGGAIYNAGKDLVIKGCTFFRNSAYDEGGAIMNTGNLVLTGNVFYGNTSNSSPYGNIPNSSSIVKTGDLGTIASEGFNIVDIAFGTEAGQSGWLAESTDKIVNTLSFSPATFRPLADSGIVDNISIRPENYPSFDFYNDSINESSAASGAVQNPMTGSGFLIDLVYNSRWGSVVVTGNYDEDKLYTGSITIEATTAIAGAEFSSWQVNGNTVTGNPHTFTISEHTKIEAIFSQVQGILLVDNFTDIDGSEERQGTLRYALTNAESGDIIRFIGVRPGIDVIELNFNKPKDTSTSILPEIKVNLTIEGNGITLVGNPLWTTSMSNNHMLYIDQNAEVKISRIHFKGGKAEMRGAVIRNDGNLTLESCIFSNNAVLMWGGAIGNEYGNSLIIKGCTFYGNIADMGGAIGLYQGSLTLVGNLFYENTGLEGYPILWLDSREEEKQNIISEGYNAVDVEFGQNVYIDEGPEPNLSGWDAAEGDITFSALGISGTPINTTTFEPAAAGLRAVMPSTAISDFPITDFYGNPRVWPGAPGAVN